MTSQRKRRDEDEKRTFQIRIDCDRLPRPFDRLIVLLQPEISTTFAAIPKCRILILRTEPYRLVEKFDGLFL